METPSQAALHGGSAGNQPGTNYVSLDGAEASTKGVFDATGLKVPAQAQWPRAYA